MKKIRKITAIILTMMLFIMMFTVTCTARDDEQDQSDVVTPTTQSEDSDADYMRAGQWFWYVEGHKQ